MKLFCAVLCILLAIAGCSKGINLSTANRELLETDAAFAKQSVATNAAEAFRAYFAADAMTLPAQSGPVIGRDSIYAHMKEGSGSYTLAWDPQKAEVSSSGDLGYTWGTSTLTYTENGQKKIIHGKYVSVWRKQPDGSWKVIVDIGNHNPTPEIG